MQERGREPHDCARVMKGHCIGRGGHSRSEPSAGPQAPAGTQADVSGDREGMLTMACGFSFFLGTQVCVSEGIEMAFPSLF